MSPTKTLLLALAWLFLLVAPGMAQTRYVSDQLIITLRAAPKADAAVVTTLKTDAPLTILEEDGSFLKVRTEKGEEGYVLSQYVTSDLPKSIQLSRLQKERDQLQSKLSQLEQSQGATGSELQQARQQQQELAKELETARRQASTLGAKYEALQKDAKDVVAVTNERDQLKAENAKFGTELDRLREENNSLLRSGMIRWFLAGAGVFFLGWLIGKLSRKKRRGF